jgi:hypothetical protein
MPTQLAERPQEIKPTSSDQIHELIPAQDGFIFTSARYPAYVAAWGTGKSESAIIKAMDLSESYAGNLGMIFRKEYTDLRDSTVKDFETYTGMSVNSSREVVLHNGSTIMFRHIEELNNIQNLNLGWYWIEQAEELDTEAQYLTLFGRMRRKGYPHAGFITANTKGHNWIWKLWKMNGLVEAVKKAMAARPDLFLGIKRPEEMVELYEAKTSDNAHNLSPEFLASLEILKDASPNLYNRFVLNSWDDDDMSDLVIPGSWIDQAMQRNNALLGDVYLGVDVARFGDDRTVIFPIKGRIGMSPIVLHGNDTMQVCGQICRMASDMNAVWIGIDTIGIGAGVYDRLNELNLPVHEVNVAEASPIIDSKTGKPKFRNMRSQLWWMAREALDPRPEVQPSPVSLATDQHLREELATPKYTINSAGQIEVEPKDDMKERIGRSPDIADAFCIAIYGVLGVVPKPMIARSAGNLLNSRTPSWL